MEKRNGRLHAAPVGQTMDELRAMAANRFFAERPNAEVEFNALPKGGMQLALQQGPGTLRGERVKAAPALDSAGYAGWH